MRKDEDSTCHIWMWITYSRVSKSYHSSLKRTRGKYENQTSGNVFWKRAEVSKRQSNKTEKNKTDFSNTNPIRSVSKLHYGGSDGIRIGGDHLEGTIEKNTGNY